MCYVRVFALLMLRSNSLKDTRILSKSAEASWSWLPWLPSLMPPHYKPVEGLPQVAFIGETSWSIWQTLTHWSSSNSPSGGNILGKEPLTKCKGRQVCLTSRMDYYRCLSHAELHAGQETVPLLVRLLEERGNAFCPHPSNFTIPCLSADYKNKWSWNYL